MFGVAQARLADGLKNLRNVVCGYCRPGKEAGFCDCKYGIETPASAGSEQTGCPEALMASRLVAALTPLEFQRACRRAKVQVYGPADPPLKAAKRTRKAVRK